MRLKLKVANSCLRCVAGTRIIAQVFSKFTHITTLIYKSRLYRRQRSRSVTLFREVDAMYSSNSCSTANLRYLKIDSVSYSQMLPCNTKDVRKRLSSQSAANMAKILGVTSFSISGDSIAGIGTFASNSEFCLACGFGNMFRGKGSRGRLREIQAVLRSAAMMRSYQTHEIVSYPLNRTRFSTAVI
jgi:hypothetical protein